MVLNTEASAKVEMSYWISREYVNRQTFAEVSFEFLMLKTKQFHCHIVGIPSQETKEICHSVSLYVMVSSSPLSQYFISIKYILWLL